MATSSGSEGAENHRMAENDVNLPACTSAFDALWFCYSPVNQMKKYYREGTYDDCDAHRWRLATESGGLLCMYASRD